MKRTKMPHATTVTAMGRFFVHTFLRCCILLSLPVRLTEQVEWSRVSIAYPPSEGWAMAEFTRELFLQALDEWGRYAGAYGNLPAAEQADFLKAQGYASMRDLLAHVAVWWEEARGIIAETIKRGDGPARK